MVDAVLGRLLERACRSRRPSSEEQLRSRPGPAAGDGGRRSTTVDLSTYDVLLEPKEDFPLARPSDVHEP